MKSWLVKLAVAIASILSPAAPMILTALGLCLFDLISGVLAARHRKEAITSAGISRTVVKLLVYELAIILGYLTQTYLTGSTIPCASIVASMVGLTELLSCLENMNELSDNGLLNKIIEVLGSKNQK